MYLHRFAGMLCLAAVSMAAAQESVDTQTSASQYVISTELARLTADVRVDWQHEGIDGETVDANSGFKGKYIMFRLDGTIVPGLNYSWRQRLNRITNDVTFFDQTDWLYVQYKYDRFSFSAGKEVVAMGGWEYDRYPVDIYSSSVFWENIPCFQFGATVGIDLGANTHISAQVTQGMWHNKENSNTYCYNLMWTGKYGIYRTLSSVNLMEYAPGKYINYIVLGNRLDWDRWMLEADVMNRAARHQTFFGKDMSVMAELSYRPKGDRWRIFGKYTYDINHSGTDADLTVADGTKLNMAGGGLEFYPLKAKRTSLRLHANCFYSWGHNANPGDVMQDKSLIVNVGIRWFMDIFSVRK